jgi:adenylate kinase family enzyme
MAANRLFQPVAPAYTKQQVIFIIGGPGSGKGTHCKKLVEAKRYHHISTGDLVRSMSRIDENGRESAEELAYKKFLSEKISRGEFLGDQFIIDIVKSEMLNHPQVPGFLIDGCPRTLDQAHLFAACIKSCDMVLFFDTTDEIMTRRMLGRAAVEHRSDDNIETIARRLKTYQEKTLPVVEHLKATCGETFKRIDSSGNAEDVAVLVAEAVAEKSAGPDCKM